MSQRNSEYARKDRDSYQTPTWVTDAVAPHLRNFGVKEVWEPAAGNGQMVKALERHGFNVTATDIADDNYDFLECDPLDHYDAIVTNPPYGLAQEFVERALQLTEPLRGTVAMLLRVDYDSAATRLHLFADCPAFALKVVLTKRIVWFEPKTANPSENHAWYLWSWRHGGAPTIAYAGSTP
jgi:hypothetical protein